MSHLKQVALSCCLLLVFLRKTEAIPSALSPKTAQEINRVSVVVAEDIESKENTDEGPMNLDVFLEELRMITMCSPLSKDNMCDPTGKISPFHDQGEF